MMPIKQNDRTQRLTRSSGGALILCVAATLAGWVQASSWAADITPQQTEFFENQIRPILANNCYKCHSLEQGASKAGLTLDTHEGMMKGGEGGPLFVSGDPANSVIIRAISYDDPDLQMPPRQRLTDQEIADMTAWIKMGAPDPRVSAPSKLTGLTDKARNHWAYQPVTSPGIPSVKNEAWCQTMIDRFALAKLEENGMTPAPPASKETLIRRAYYDLVGLPPTPAEIEAFKADHRPDAFATVVDRLLASPQYGERWGRHWLDTARYADTIGGDVGIKPLGMEYRYPYAWSYRDYVINAFNSDKPYDQFIREQLAADKLPECAEDPSILAALGFLTVGIRFQNPNDVINDRIDVVSKGFLAATVTCARCHDHRFDPIPTTDYYALHGIFASTLEPPDKPIVNASDPQRFTIFQEKVANIQEGNKQAYEQLTTTLNGEFLDKAPLYLKHAARGEGKRTAADILAIDKEAAQNGMDRELTLSIRAAIQRQPYNDPTFTPLKRLSYIPEADFAKTAPTIIDHMIRRQDQGFVMNPLVLAAFKATPPATFDDVVAIYANLFAQAAPLWPTYVKAAFAWSPDEDSNTPSPTAQMMMGMVPVNTPAQVAGVDPNLVPFLNIPMPVEPYSKLNTTEVRRLVEAMPNPLRQRAVQMHLKLDLNSINELELTDPGAPERAMILADNPHPHDSPVFIRGQEQVKGAVIPRHFLTMLSPDGKAPPFRQGSGRLQLAEAIASKSNPLTARVMVNRVWMYHFGQGFVPTPDDLGNQSEPPSHPELLDYLANYFMDNNWSLKKLHRMIMLSSVYQESSDPNKDYATADPENRLLSHANIRRLDFESLRDSLLTFSGKLDRTIGGQPINLTEEPYSYRRSVYGYIDRGNLPELMAYFDFSDPNMANSRRNSTIVPQQALFLMNSPMIVGVVRDILARQEVAEVSNETQKIAALYLIIFQRNPKTPEIQLAEQFLTAEDAQSGAAPEKPHVPLGSSPPKTVAAAPNMMMMNMNMQGKGSPTRAIQNQGERVARTPLTPWESLAQAMLFANEMSYVN